MRHFMKAILDKAHQIFNQQKGSNSLWEHFTAPSDSIDSLPNHFRKPYYSPFNPVFLHKLNDTSVFSNNNFFLARDGLFNLSLFFMLYPRPPKEVKAHFLFPSLFKDFIPTSWKEISLSYHYSSLEQESTIKNVMLTGHIFLDSLNSERFDYFLKQIQPMTKVSVLMDDSAPTYAHAIYDLSMESTLFKKSVYEKLRSNFLFLNERDLFGLELDASWTLVDLDDPFLVADKWSNHHFKSYGMRGLNKQMTGTTSNFPLSAFESICLNTWESMESSKFNEIYIEYKMLQLQPISFYRVFRNFIRERFFSRS